MSTNEFQLPPEGVHPLSDAIREAIGAGPTDPVDVLTPQFERTDGQVIRFFPSTVQQFDNLKRLDKTALRALGLGPWDESGLWLFPKEWYDHIPEGYGIIDIMGRHEPFEHGKTDDDIRYGLLAFGIIAPKTIKSA